VATWRWQLVVAGLELGTPKGAEGSSLNMGYVGSSSSKHGEFPKMPYFARGRWQFWRCESSRHGSLEAWFSLRVGLMSTFQPGIIVPWINSLESWLLVNCATLLDLPGNMDHHGSIFPRGIETKSPGFFTRGGTLHH
jgi:hypothetical protein